MLTGLLLLSCRAARILTQLKSQDSANLYSCVQQHPGLDRSSKASNLEAFLAAVLFAAHPIHTEAVASVVGHAELLSAALALLALMAYVSAASTHSYAQHYRRLAASLCILCLSALAKEIGITMVSCSCRILRRDEYLVGSWLCCSCWLTQALHGWCSCMQHSLHMLQHASFASTPALQHKPSIHLHFALYWHEVLQQINMLLPIRILPSGSAPAASSKSLDSAEPIVDSSMSATSKLLLP